MAAIDGKIFLTHNDCYKTNQKMVPKGIVVHSTGANNTNLRRYIAPDDGIIGKNLFGNDWNHSGEDVCVHAFIGTDAKGNVKTYQTLPFDVCCWGCGGGSKGSYNYNPAYIQFEMCEDDLSNPEYCKKVFKKAVNLCVWLCKKYSINPSNIVSHHEAHQKGYASDHIDPHHWWNKHGYTMDGFRKEVKKRLDTPILDFRGFKKGDKTRGVFAVKELLLIAYKKGIVKTKVDENNVFGGGTEKAVNEVLKIGKYYQNGTAGNNFIKYLSGLIRKKL